MNAFADADTALEELRRRGLPDVVAQLWRSSGLGPSGSLGTSPCNYFRLAKDLVSLVPSAKGLCPLWEVNGEAVVGILPNGIFVKIYYEDASKGDAAIKMLAENYSGLIEIIMFELEEAGLKEWKNRVRRVLDGSK